MHLPANFFSNRQLDTLVENKTSYALKQAEMHIYETHQVAEQVLLQFEAPVLASMLTGKKVMHLREQKPFAFLPGESIIMPREESMCIDFPEAGIDHPTRCMAMTLDEEMLWGTICKMNEMMPRVDELEWSMLDFNFQFTNDAAIFGLLQRMLFLCGENNPHKDLFVQNTLQELIIRILQANVRGELQAGNMTTARSSRLAFIVQHIRTHLHEPLSIDRLSQKACMSRSHFYRTFKQELGVSPLDFILGERIKKAMDLLTDPDVRIKEVYLACGFESRSYFNRVFKRFKHISPSAFRKQAQLRSSFENGTQA